MIFESAGAVEQQIWQMRLADQPRAANRTLLNQHFNGKAPFDESKSEENNVDINVNFLEGSNLLSQARRQWNRAMLGTGQFFTIRLDSGPARKRGEWGRIITRAINRYLKQAEEMEDQIESEGANTMLHGIAPSIYDEMRNPYPTPIFPGSLLIPSDTNRNLKNLAWFAVFREWTPAELAGMVCGPKRDPGWNMDKVNNKIVQIGSETRKAINASAFQYMPERIEELSKGDMGFWGSDAVPTIDAWDFYFRDQEDGQGWYRRTILDWDENAARPTWDSESQFLYTSGKRKYANRLCEILHVNFGDCAAVAPFKYHSIRSLGWLLFPICELQNRLRCRFTESVFQQLMWFFRTASQGDYERIKIASFEHMGVIPQGISFVTANERFKPDQALVEMAIAQNRQIMGENAAAFIQDMDQGGRKGEMTATETMARVNMVNAMVSGVLAKAYSQSKRKYLEQCRRFCIKHSPFRDVRGFRLACLKEGVPEEMLDSSRWMIECEKVMGGGNKTLEIAQANQLMSVRPNVNPDAQRRIDHIFIEVNTDDPALAEELVPVESETSIPPSAHDAQLATDRILRGLNFIPPKDFVAEDYIQVWLADLGHLIDMSQQSGNVASAEQIIGMQSLAGQIGKMLQILGSNPAERQKARQYSDSLGKMMNLVKAFEQRMLEQQQKAQQSNGNGGGVDPQTAAKIQGTMMLAKVKADNASSSHAEKTAQRRISFEQGLQEDAQKHAVEMQKMVAEPAEAPPSEKPNAE